ncbi:hypothetical protein R6Q59_033530 [Mikania micrantha]
MMMGKEAVSEPELNEKLNEIIKEILKEKEEEKERLNGIIVELEAEKEKHKKEKEAMSNRMSKIEDMLKTLQEDDEEGKLEMQNGGPWKRWGHTCNAVRGGQLLYVFGGYGEDNTQTNKVHVYETGFAYSKKQNIMIQVRGTKREQLSQLLASQKKPSNTNDEDDSV